MQKKISLKKGSETETKPRRSKKAAAAPEAEQVSENPTRNVLEELTKRKQITVAKETWEKPRAKVMATVAKMDDASTLAAGGAAEGIVSPPARSLSDPYIETPWKLIKSYYSGHQLERIVRHQLESYNYFIGQQLAKTIDMFNPVRVVSKQDFNEEWQKHYLEVYIRFENLCIYRPEIHENNGAKKIMFPQEARLRNFTYAAGTRVDVNIQYVIRSGPEPEDVKTVHKTLPGIQMGKIPIMLKSDICLLTQYKHLTPAQTGECELDPGGYFIIKGSEKTVLGQERAGENRVYCYNIEKNDTKYLWKAEIKSVPAMKCISPKQTIAYLARYNGIGCPIVVDVPRLKHPVPLFALFRALNVISDRSICEICLLDIQSEASRPILEALEASVWEGNMFLTEEDGLRHLTSCVMYTPMNVDRETAQRRRREFLFDVLKNDLFPHVQNRIQKIYFLGYMVNRLLCAHLDIHPADDRDSYLNKRVDTCGASMNNLYRNFFNKMTKDMEKGVVREIDAGSWRSTEDFENIINLTNVYKIIKSAPIENGLKRALSTGDFGIKHSNSNKVGVAQVYNRLNYSASLSHIRRISAPIEKSGKLIAPRKLHGTSWGFLCPAETPEGPTVGIVKNLACLTHITTPSDSGPLYDYILPHILPFTATDEEEPVSSAATAAQNLPPEELFRLVKVFINGAWVGVVRDPLPFYEQLKRQKHRGIINVYTSIVFDYKRKEIRVCNEAGRLTRPVLRVENNRLLLTDEVVRDIESGRRTWEHLLLSSNAGDDAVMEYIDPEEQKWAMIATFPSDLEESAVAAAAATGDGNSSSNAGKPLRKYTHCEIHPSTIFGFLASCIPFPDHNQSPRNTYQCAQGKQAMGTYATNYLLRMDTTAYKLHYSMRPLVETRVLDIIRLWKIPSGVQLIVAIMSYTGYNQEDSLLVNAGSVDRGMALTTVYHTEKDEDKQKINGDEEIRCRPDPQRTKGMKIGNYTKVNARGVVPENTLVENGDVIIAKVVPIKENRNDPSKVIKYEDHSKIFRTFEETYIDRNVIDRNGDGYVFAKVRTRTMRKPDIGDKFSSRHGQKGTVSHKIPEQDMPFTASGLRPDIIINPHAIPSRMTIGQLKETHLGKVLLTLGLFGDGTAFNDLDVADISKLLLDAGCEAYGNELMYNPLTGEQIESSVFMGPTYYQRLKHMVNDKVHSRSFGPMVTLTRQPQEGRSRDGGLRFGEMERDCMVSHGASRFVRERLYDVSDKFAVHVCKRCGSIATVNHHYHLHLCHMCSNRTDFARIQIPYACKLLFQELNAMSVAPRFLTSD